MNINRYILFIPLIVGLSGCRLFTEQQKEGAVAEIGEEVLFRQDLDAVTVGHTGEDSAKIANQYIYQWATSILAYQKARRYSDKDLENQVEAYRRSLYTHKYNERLIRQKMSTQVADTLIKDFYEQHTDQFILHEHILKGIFVVVPNGAPKMDKLRKWMATPNEKNIEQIEKYAYQYASGYELFLDSWTTANQLLMWMPYERNEFTQHLGQHSQIELSDSVSTYILQLTDLRKANEKMPFDYAKPQIKDIILARRQVDFLKQQYHELYNEALRFKKLQLYEKD